jgi:3-phenylpropionate/cinnamic acid dioxygenase small subunit
MMSSAEEERRIIALINRYATAVDSGDWPLLRTCWSDDVQVDFETGQSWPSADALNEFMRKFHTGLRTLHMVGNYVLEDVASDRARGRTYFKAVLFRADGSLLMRTDGWYNDEFAKIAGEWKIAKRHAHMINFERGPGELPQV